MECTAHCSLESHFCPGVGAPSHGSGVGGDQFGGSPTRLSRCRVSRRALAGTLGRVALGWAGVTESRALIVQGPTTGHADHLKRVSLFHVEREAPPAGLYVPGRVR